MEAIGTYWWVWLLGWALCLAYLVFNQLRRMNGMLGGIWRADARGAVRSFQQGLFGMVIAGGAGTLCIVLFIVAVLINIVS
ncbi:MAG: hypothetical protein HY455_01170 [Parcubacteria group bacterium]|nr:hypothetical protein [Parcubacteria group bacterium]